MTPQTVIETLLEKNKQIRKSDITRSIGWKSQGSLQNAITRDNALGMSVRTFFKILDALDCSLVVRANDGTDKYIVDDAFINNLR